MHPPITANGPLAGKSLCSTDSLVGLAPKSAYKVGVVPCLKTSQKMTKNRRGGKVTQTSHNLEHRVVALSFGSYAPRWLLGLYSQSLFSFRGTNQFNMRKR